MNSTVTINMRVSKEEKQHLTETAARLGLSLSAFLREAAIKRAHKELGGPKLVSSAESSE